MTSFALKTRQAANAFARAGPLRSSWLLVHRRKKSAADWLRRETGALGSLHGVISLTGFDAVLLPFEIASVDASIGRIAEVKRNNGRRSEQDCAIGKSRSGDSHFTVIVIFWDMTGGLNGKCLASP